jgi:hypothetical protein
LLLLLLEIDEDLDSTIKDGLRDAIAPSGSESAELPLLLRASEVELGIL